MPPPSAAAERNESDENGVRDGGRLLLLLVVGQMHSCSPLYILPIIPTLTYALHTHTCLDFASHNHAGGSKQHQHKLQHIHSDAHSASDADAALRAHSIRLYDAMRCIYELIVPIYLRWELTHNRPSQCGYSLMLNESVYIDTLKYTRIRKMWNLHGNIHT